MKQMKLFYTHFYTRVYVKRMAVQVEWNLLEASLLLEAYLEIQNNTISKMTAIHRLSEGLRKGLIFLLFSTVARKREECGLEQRMLLQ